MNGRNMWKRKKLGRNSWFESVTIAIRLNHAHFNEDDNQNYIYSTALTVHSISIVHSAHSNVFISSYFSEYNCIVHSHVHFQCKNRKSKSPEALKFYQCTFNSRLRIQFINSIMILKSVLQQRKTFQPLLNSLKFRFSLCMKWKVFRLNVWMSVIIISH